MVIMNRYKEADLKKKRVKELRTMVYKAGIHGLKVAGARKEELIIALITGSLPSHEDHDPALEQSKRFAAVFAGVLDLLADAVAERLERNKDRPKPTSTYSRG